LNVILSIFSGIITYVLLKKIPLNRSLKDIIRINKTVLSILIDKTLSDDIKQKELFSNSLNLLIQSLFLGCYSILILLPALVNYYLILSNKQQTSSIITLSFFQVLGFLISHLIFKKVEK
jgi:Fe2+ transport system protein B